jgi:molybdopterin molybdotransferase
MISVEQAIAIVEEHVEPTSDFELIEVAKATGCVVFKDIISEINMPPFRQSAMDGYALCLHDDLRYNLKGEVKAGDNYHPILKKGEAIRIFTGSPVPDTANAVIMQERVRSVDDHILIDAPVAPNDNIRPLGEQILKGQTALKKGAFLSPASIGFISSLGIENISVYKKPSVAVIVTGNELVQAGNSLNYGQIYESNGPMLTSALNELGYQNVSNYKVEDSYDATFKILEKVIGSHDLILVSGGISVGDYDFVGKALKDLQVAEQFYKVNQKPGKPLFFGKKENKIVFALPGNPAAALTCFYIYVQTALQKLSGNSDHSLTKTMAISKSEFIKKGDRAHFLKAIYKDNFVEILGGQNSSMLQTFTSGNALVYLSAESDSIKINDEVEVILLPIR